MRLSAILRRQTILENHINKWNPLFAISSRQASRKAEQYEVTMLEKMYLRKPQIQKWKRPPFVKNMFRGEFDTHLMPYPELIDFDGIVELDKSAKRLSNLLKEKASLDSIDTQTKLPEDIMQDFKDLGFFGRLVPTDLGGLGMTYTQYARLNEPLSVNWSIGTTLCAHELLGIQALLLYGTEEQKAKYVPDLASGKKTIAFCCHESISGMDVLSMGTKAYRTEDMNTYIINGHKDWIANIIDADLYIVIAQDSVYGCTPVGVLTAFLIEKGTKGVEIMTGTEKIGLAGLNCGAMRLNDVMIPKENILGQPKSAGVMIQKIREYCRFGIGTISFPVLKSLLDNVTEYVIRSERVGKSLVTNPFMTLKLSKILTTIYAMESIAYFTAGIYDSSDNPDCLLESTIMKIYNTEGTLYCLKEMMNILSCYSLEKTQIIEKFYNDARALMVLEGGNDVARLQIGLTGLQFAGGKNFEWVEKARNPFFFPLEKIKHFRRNRRMQAQKFKYKHDIAGHLHPSFVWQGNELEECLQRFHFLTDHVLVTHGANVLQKQYEPMLLADLAINLYARTAVLSRSSRSYCIGMRNAGFELTIAYAFCDTALGEFRETFRILADGTIKNSTENHEDIGKHIAFSKGYFVSHALKYTF